MNNPWDIVVELEADNGRLAKEDIIAREASAGNDEFFAGCRLALDAMTTFGVKQVDTKESSGKILVNLYKDSLNHEYGIGQQLQFSTKIISHKKPNNPNQFDYGKYLTSKSILAQVYVCYLQCISFHSVEILHTFHLRLRLCLEQYAVDHHRQLVYRLHEYLVT